MKATDGKVKRVFDTTAKSDNIVRSLFSQLPGEQRLHATTGFSYVLKVLLNLEVAYHKLRVAGRLILR